MVFSSLLIALLGNQAPTPAIDAASFYGAKTFTSNAEFGILPERFVIGFAPENIEEVSMHVFKADGAEVFGGGVYETFTDYPAFKLLHLKGVPTLNLSESGAYYAEFRHKGVAINKFPFEIQKKSEGDEFNPTYFWDFRTPVDRMGTLNFSNTEPNGKVYVSAWVAPRREGFGPNASATMSLHHGGKKIAESEPFYFQKKENERQYWRLNGLKGFQQFTKADLAKLSGSLEAQLTMGTKVIRKFKWSMTAGKVKPIARSESSYTPRTDYWMPRNLGGVIHGYQGFHLMEQYWSTSE